MWLPTLLLLLACTHSPSAFAQSSTGGEESSTGLSNSTDLFNISSSTGPFVNSTNVTHSSSTGTRTQVESSSSSTASSEVIPPPSTTGSIIPGGSIGGVSSFGSTDAIFFTTIRDVWIGVILWTMVFTAFFFFAAGAIAVRVNRRNQCGWKIFAIPPIMLCVGAAVGFMHGAVSAALIAAITICQSQRLRAHIERDIDCSALDRA